MQLSRDELKRAYRTMRLIRGFEERVRKEFEAGNIPGFVHVYNGAEASGTAICFDLTDEDYIGSTHRGHGHCIAKGVDVKGMMMEIMGKGTGVCGGKGGSMHIADLDKGMLGANAIVGGAPPLANGAALTAKTKKTGKVSVSFGGDGASNQGTVFEALNMAVVLKLPTIFVTENNGFGEHTASSYACGAPSIADRAASFGMPAETVDGTDFFAVHEAMGRALERARGGEGPSFIETVIPRFDGHFVGDPQPFRTQEEMDEARANDCLVKFREKVLGASLLEQSDFDEIDESVNAELEEAVKEGLAAPLPDMKTLTKDVYVSY